MRDLIFVALIVAFFALSVVFVRLCERIVGAGEVVVADVSTTDEPLEVAA